MLNTTNKARVKSLRRHAGRLGVKVVTIKTDIMPECHMVQPIKARVNTAIADALLFTAENMYRVKSGKIQGTRPSSRESVEVVVGAVANETDYWTAQLNHRRAVKLIADRKSRKGEV